MITKLLNAILLIQCLMQTSDAFEAFAQADEGQYIASFDTLIKDSYSAPLPNDLTAACKNKNQDVTATPKSISSSMSSSELQSFCGFDSICTIPAGYTVTMNSNLNVAALVVRGNLIWNDVSQSANQQYMCAGYIAVIGGKFDMNLVEKQGFIYIKNNGLKDDALKTRALGSYGAGKINIAGRPLARTWSLLAERALFGMSSISLIHNPEQMGWRIGDRIVIAPTDPLSKGNAEDYVIGGFGSDNSINLMSRFGTTKGVISSFFEARPIYTGNNMSALVQAEVINLSRNIIITGDDFQHVACVNDGVGRPSDAIQMDHCSCWNEINRKRCTLGLHTIAMGPGSVLSLQHTRVEKCGQRGILGKYCIHMHLITSCPDCKIIGNAVEYGHQRGTVIHGTHLSTVEQNVYNDVRGGIIYVEDGNEMYNRIFYNVAICPWAFQGEKRGCTVPGTDNEQADTVLNQSGLWGVSFTNYAIGNRFANSFNGMLYQEQGFPTGRGSVTGMVCPALQQMGRLEGNTFHGCGRFGTYVLANVYPKKIDRTVSKNGIATLSSCQEWTSTGEDNGYPNTFMDNIDYGNAFVGQYGAGDLQYRFHSSISNLNLIYWKETKNFQDGCSAHIADSYYEDGNMALPGGHGTFILENMIFHNQVHFESSHHCQVGVTGILCMPTYVFVNMQWTGVISDSSRILQWGPNNGAMFTLGPDDEANLKGNYLFPAGYTSIVHPYWSYLLALDKGTSCFTSTQVALQLGQDPLKFNSRYDNGAIFCKRPVRRLEIFTMGQNGGNLQLELWQNGNRVSSVSLNFFAVDGLKQGFSATVVPGLDHQYRLSNIPGDWIIEFSDPVFGNRWKRDEIDLVVAGRNCPSPVHSQHDRRYIWSGENYLKVKGRGACTSFPDMKPVDCKTQPKLSNVEYCPGKCQKACNNGYCDCETGECLCNPGFTGLNCAIDTCAAAGCVNGNCVSKYLGGDLAVTKRACVCMNGWYGDKCDSRTAPSLPDPASPCYNGCHYYADADIMGENLNAIQTSDAKTCCDACSANPNCKAWVISVICFLKAEAQRIYKPGVLSGIKCTSGSVTIPPMIFTTPPISTHCNGVCKGAYPYGCNPGYAYGYCNAGGGCSYSATSDPNWCCFKGCNTPTNAPTTAQTNNGQTTITTVATTTTRTNAPVTTSNAQISCNGKCNGAYPYGCNDGFSLGYCNSGGGCSYTTMNDPSWCCFKGCGEQQQTNAPTAPPTAAPTNAPSGQTSCNGKCQGEFPYNCNSGFSVGYCSPWGGCSYSTMTDPAWCCFKGC